MKKYIYLLLVIATTLNSCIVGAGLIGADRNSINANEVQRLENEKVVIAVQSYPKEANTEARARIDKENELVLEMLNKYWTSSAIQDITMSFIGAKKFVQSNNGYSLLYLGAYAAAKFSESYGMGGSTSFTNYSTGLYIKGAGYQFAFDMPFTSDDEFYNEVSVYATIMGLQAVLNQIKDGTLKTSYGFEKNGNRDTGVLQKKTLLIPDFLFDRKLGQDGIKSYYKHSFEVCDNDTYKDVIMNGSSDYLVPLITTGTVGKGYCEQITVVDPEDWDIIAVLQIAGMGNHNRRVFNYEDFDERIKLSKKQWKQISKDVKKL